jgi:hypothetical protein
MKDRALSLKLRLLWYRYCWRFHWAHYPRCAPYSGETLRLGELRLCRSCVYLYGGMLVGLLVANHFAPEARDLFWWVLGTAFSFMLGLSKPDKYAKFSRTVRSAIRLSTGLMMGCWIHAATHGQLIFGGAMLLLTPFAFWWSRNEWGGLRLRRCTECAESQSKGVCSGYTAQARCIRSYEEAATAWAEGQFRPPGFVDSVDEVDP